MKFRKKKADLTILFMFLIKNTENTTEKFAKIY